MKVLSFDKVINDRVKYIEIDIPEEFLNKTKECLFEWSREHKMYYSLYDLRMLDLTDFTGF
jgi:hypothetical protein